MTTDRDFDRIAMAWLAGGPDQLSDRVLADVVDEIHVTRQRHGLSLPRRFESMTTPARVAAAAVLGVLAIGGAIYAVSPGTFLPGAGLSPTPSPTAPPIASPTPSPSSAFMIPILDKPMTPGRYEEIPFGRFGVGMCYGQPSCVEDEADDPIRIRFTVPAGWIGGSAHVLFAAEGKVAPNGAGLVFSRGGGMHAEPCGGASQLTTLVGPTVDDFVTALVDHPKLEVTAPVDVSLAGYAGKYVDLQVPEDISACPTSYFPWEPGIYAQGPGSRWHLWILDVEGVRVVIQSTDYEGTPPQRQAELRAIVESITIEP